MDDFQGIAQAPEFSAQADGLEGAEPNGAHQSSNIAAFLWRCWFKRKMMLWIVAVGILASILYALSLQNFYTSTTTLMPPQAANPYSGILGMLSPGGSAADVASEALGLETPGDLFVSILGSRNVQDGVINRLDLIHHYGAKGMEDARRALLGSTKIAADPKSGVISITVTADNPILASKIAATYVEELDRVVTENSTSSARRERIFLEERVRDIKQQLDDSAKQLSQFSTKSGAIDISSQTRSMVEEGEKLQADLIEGKSQLAALRETYSEDNSKVKALEAHNAELQRELDKMGGMTQGAGQNSDTVASPYPTADELPTLGLTYYDLERKLRVDEALWEALTKQYEAAKVEEAAEIPSVHVLDVANIPEYKSGPIRRSIVEYGTLLSVILAGAVVFVGMLWDGMDPEGEVKRLIAGAGGHALNPTHWYWRLPGMSWVHRRLERSEGLG